MNNTSGTDNLIIGLIDFVFCFLGLFLIVILIRSNTYTIAEIPLIDGTGEVYVLIMVVFSFVFGLRNYIYRTLKVKGEKELGGKMNGHKK